MTGNFFQWKEFFPVTENLSSEGKDHPSTESFFLWQGISSCDRKFLPVTGNFFLWQEISSCGRRCLPVSVNIFLWKEISSCDRKIFLWHKISFCGRIILLLASNFFNISSLPAIIPPWSNYKYQHGPETGPSLTPWVGGIRIQYPLTYRVKSLGVCCTNFVPNRIELSDYQDLSATFSNYHCLLGTIRAYQNYQTPLPFTRASMDYQELLDTNRNY